MRRNRKTKILATLGPASSNKTIISQLFEAGADVFRLNMSHGTHEEQRARYDIIREVEKETGRPIGVLADLQGPKLRVGVIDGGKMLVTPGDKLILDLNKDPGKNGRVPLPHPEIFSALKVGSTLLIDDGKIRLRVDLAMPDHAETTVEVGGFISDRKGVNVPDVVLPLAALTDKDAADLIFALELGVDWIALSFVQRPQDVAEVKRAVGDKALVMAKIEKPAAIDHLDEIIALSDGVMIARGDLGVELPPENVPGMQRAITRAARRAGKPVVVATQMLESMITSPIATRAEVSDVGTAVFEGADAVMLSAESAAGDYPVEAVATMNRIAEAVEQDPFFIKSLKITETTLEPTTADAITAAASQVADTLQVAAIVCYTSSGSTAIRASRERPQALIVTSTPEITTARRLAIVWGLHCTLSDDATSFRDMVEGATTTAYREGIALPGDRIVVTAGVPFGTPGKTNILRIVRIPNQPDS